MAAALWDKGYTPFFSSRPAEMGATSTSRGGGAPQRGQQQVRGRAGGARFHENRPREGRGPGDPHRRGRPQTHQRPRAAGWLLPVGGTGGVLGRHTNVCHGTQPRWEAPGGHRWRHQHLHGCHHQPGHGALPRGLGGLRFPEGHGRRRGGHDPHDPPVPAQGGHLPGQRAPPAVVPAGKRLGSRHGTPPGDRLGPPPVCPALPGLLSAAGPAAVPTPYSHTVGRLRPYDAEAAPVQHCLLAAVTTPQDEPSLAHWLGPAEQHAWGSMPTAAVDKVFENLHAAHDALAHVVGRRQPSLAGTDPAEGDPPKSGKQLQAAVLRFDTLASGPRRRSGSRRSCGVRRPGSARPHRVSYRRSWRGNQPPSRRTFANSAHSWRHTASAPSRTSGAATPPTSPSDGKPCGGP